MLDSLPDIPLIELHDDVIQQAGVRVRVLRLDLTHPLISGNKWFKLKYNLQQARTEGKQTLLSFGGAYSNHIHALAAAGAEYGFNTIGVIRGEASTPLNSTLKFAQECGMELHYVSREFYRRKASPEIQAELLWRFGEVYWIPEGGSNALAVKGCAEIASYVPDDVDTVCCACGTGGTLAGLVTGLEGRAQVLAVAVLQGAGFLYGEVRALLAAAGEIDKGNWQLELDAHWGGYARAPDQLLAFIRTFEDTHQIQLEQVYTGKLFGEIWRRLECGDFRAGQNILVVHSGGLQGRASDL